MEQTYFAQVYEGKVNNVICASQEFVDHYDDGLPGVWLLTDINTRGNVHYGANGQPDGLPPFRGNFAGIGYTYDYANDVFIAPQPYKNAVLDTNTWLWQQPVPELPTITQVVPIVNGVQVFFLQPTNPPAGGFVSYKYSIKTATTEDIQTITVFPLKIVNLQGGELYTVNVGCVDTEGNTYWSVNPEEFTPLLATAPSITGALPENEGAIITWAVAENQSDAIPSLGVVHWKIGYKPEASGGDYTWVESTNESPTYELTGLTNGTKYAIVVTDIVNGVESEPSQPFYVTPSAT